jgi:hypothetical protein
VYVNAKASMLDLSHHPLPTIFLVSVVLIVAAGELGHWLGRRATDHGGENVAALKAAILGLLALMIGFTFAMAQTRFELRREAVLNEAKAIGTTPCALAFCLRRTAPSASSCCVTT